MIFVMAGGSGKSKQQNPICGRNLNEVFITNVDEFN
jgi:hypothetical protein